MDLKKTKVKRSTVTKMTKMRTKTEKKVEAIVESKPVKEIVKVRSGKKRAKRAPPVKQISQAGPVLGGKSGKKKKTRSRREVLKRGVCYFSHIPHGFGGEQLKKYCSQFGIVTGVYEPVSKLGNSRGYAFVEFLHEEVAKIVADTMNNYLMFNRLIKCEYVPPEKQRPWIFRIKRNNKQIAELSRKVALEQSMKPLTIAEKVKQVEKRKKKINSLQNKLKKQGIDFQLEVDEN